MPTAAAATLYRRSEPDDYVLLLPLWNSLTSLSGLFAPISVATDADGHLWAGMK